MVEPLRRAAETVARRGVRETIYRALEPAFFRRQRPPERLYWALAPRYYRRRVSADVAAFEPTPDPFKLLRVDPDRITRFTGREYPHWLGEFEQFGAVEGGGWDRREEVPIDEGAVGTPAELYLAERFEESVLYESLAARFRDGTPWTETPFVERVSELLADEEADAVWNGCTTEAEVRERCRRLEGVYESMRRRGCVSQRALTRREGDRSCGFWDAVCEEIRVDVGRDGELLFVNGRHRLSFAKLLDLETVPVVVGVRHADWMTAREAALRGERPCDHPDLWAIGGRSSGAFP